MYKIVRQIIVIYFLKILTHIFLVYNVNVLLNFVYLDKSLTTQLQPSINLRTKTNNRYSVMWNVIDKCVYKAVTRDKQFEQTLQHICNYLFYYYSYVLTKHLLSYKFFFNNTTITFVKINLNFLWSALVWPIPVITTWFKRLNFRQKQFFLKVLKRINFTR